MPSKRSSGNAKTRAARHVALALVLVAPVIARANGAPLVAPPGFERWAAQQPASTSGTHLYAAYRRPSGATFDMLSLSGTRLPLDMDLKQFIRGQTLGQNQSVPKVRYASSCGKPLAILRFDQDFGSHVAAMIEGVVVADHVAYVAAYSHARGEPDAKDAVRAVQRLCIGRTAPEDQ